MIALNVKVMLTEHTHHDNLVPRKVGVEAPLGALFCSWISGFVYDASGAREMYCK